MEAVGGTSPLYISLRRRVSIFGDSANLFYASIEPSACTGGAQRSAAGLGLEVSNEATRYKRHGPGNLLTVFCQTVALAQNLGAAPQVNVAVQGQTGAQPEGAFLNFVNWVGNVIAPVGAGAAVLGGIISYATGRGHMRYLGVAVGLLAVSGLTRLLEFWIQNGTGGVS